MISIATLLKEEEERRGVSVMIIGCLVLTLLIFSIGIANIAEYIIEYRILDFPNNNCVLPCDMFL